ncbi:FadR/GntR family transcriptional regulator [Microbacterium sp. No. 7]|uniref:FadR/GntR family transcriptional regulator n=1 Tax=Microbacterium sp. No. 7 TaxID=1714373 RepID=UPI0006D2AF17|nr:FCD domain-containing protein [Microbacterium sp. No. 7]
MAESEPTVPRGALPTNTARRIMRDFAERGLQPGDTLSDEATLLKRYGVSRGTFREALRLLSFLGAITVKNGRQGGARLAVPDPKVVGSALGLVIQFDGATLDTVLEARLALDPAVASLAAINRDDDDVAALWGTVEGLRATRDARGPAFARHAIDYSLAMARATHNSVFSTIMPSLVAMTSTVRWRYPRGLKGPLAEQVAAVVEAVDRGEPAAASTAAERMQRGLMEAMRESHPEDLEKPILWYVLDEQLSQGIDALAPSMEQGPAEQDRGDTAVA